MRLRRTNFIFLVTAQKVSEQEACMLTQSVLSKCLLGLLSHGHTEVSKWDQVPFVQKFAL